MELQGKNDAPDAINEILKRYLLERDAATPDGDGLMEMAASSVLSQPARVTPSAAKEAEMLARLQAQFPENPVPGPTSRISLLKIGAAATGALALVAVAILLIVNPFADEDALSGDIATPNSYSERPQGLSGNAGDLPNTQDPDANDLSSLHNGAGTTESTLDPTVEVGTGIENQGRPTHSWVKGSKATAKGSGNPDSRPPSMRDGFVVIPQPWNEVPVREQEQFSLRELYAHTKTPSSYYQLDPTTDHLILSNEGTLLHIPRGAFVDATSGESVTTTVQVELKELYQRSDYINSNISTLANGQQLVAAGTIYVDATAAGRRLKLSKDKDIYVEFAAQRGADSQDMQLYHGSTNDRGETNFAPSIGQHQMGLVTLPQEELYFDEFYCGNCAADEGWNALLMQLWHPELKQTWIPTREFRQRLLVLRDMGYYEKGLKTYLDNAHLDLWKVDQMVADRLIEDAKGRKTQDAEIEYFHQFARQMLKQAERYEDFGLDMSKPDARKQLLLRDVSREETEKFIRIAKLRRHFSKNIEDRLILTSNGKGKVFQGVRKGKYQKAGTELVAGYLLQELGWTSLSKVATGELAHGNRREIKVRLTGNIAYENTRAFLAYSDFHSILPGKPTTGQLHRFTKVPAGTNGWIVVVGFKHNSPYIGMLPLPKDDGDRIVTVTMEQSRFDEYLAALKQID